MEMSRQNLGNVNQQQRQTQGVNNWIENNYSVFCSTFIRLFSDQLTTRIPNLENYDPKHIRSIVEFCLDVTPTLLDGLSSRDIQEVQNVRRTG